MTASSAAFTAAFALGAPLQCVAIVKLFALRARWAHLPNLERRPPVRRWASVCRAVMWATVLLSVPAMVTAEDKDDALIVVTISVFTVVLLLIVASTIASNDTGGGDGDSGGCGGGGGDG
ncbi:hypothetical protein [Lentzea sp. NPDC055074]